MNYKLRMHLRNVSRQRCPLFEMSLTPKIKFRDGRRETRLQLYEIQGATQEACGEWKKSRYNHNCRTKCRHWKATEPRGVDYLHWPHHCAGIRSYSWCSARQTSGILFVLYLLRVKYAEPLLALNYWKSRRHEV